MTILCADRAPETAYVDRTSTSAGYKQTLALPSTPLGRKAKNISAHYIMLCPATGVLAGTGLEAAATDASIVAEPVESVFCKSD